MGCKTRSRSVDQQWKDGGSSGPPGARVGFKWTATDAVQLFPREGQRSGTGRAKGMGPTDHVDLVEEVDRCDANTARLAPLSSTQSTTFHVLLTASHSLRSSPSGRTTARRRFPEPSLSTRRALVGIPLHEAARKIYPRTWPLHIWERMGEAKEVSKAGRRATGRGACALLELVLLRALGDVLLQRVSRREESELPQSRPFWA